VKLRNGGNPKGRSTQVMLPQNDQFDGLVVDRGLIHYLEADLTDGITYFVHWGVFSETLI
jgi:hypothetical protein